MNNIQTITFEVPDSPIKVRAVEIVVEVSHLNTMTLKITEPIIGSDIKRILTRHFFMWRIGDIQVIKKPMHIAKCGLYAVRYYQYDSNNVYITIEDLHNNSLYDDWGITEFN